MTETYVEWFVDSVVCNEVLCRWGDMRNVLAKRGLFELEHLALTHTDPMVRLRAGLLNSALNRWSSSEILGTLAEKDKDENVRAAAVAETVRLGWTWHLE